MCIRGKFDGHLQVFQLGERQERLIVDPVYFVRFQIPVTTKRNYYYRNAAPSVNAIGICFSPF